MSAISNLLNQKKKCHEKKATDGFSWLKSQQTVEESRILHLKVMTQPLLVTSINQPNLGFVLRSTFVSNNTGGNLNVSPFTVQKKKVVLTPHVKN